MAFIIEFYDKDGNVVDFDRLNEEVCRLWEVSPAENDWATPPGKSSSKNWNAFLGRAVMLTRAFKETGCFSPSDLLQGLCSFGGLYPTPESIDSHKYELQLIFYWIRMEYKLIVRNC